MNTTNQITNLSKVWFITGAARGIGSDLVTEALRNGYQVVATARTAESIIEAVGTHENLLALAMDVTKIDEVQQAIEKALSHFGRIDVLINNAGRFYAVFFETMSNEQIRHQMEVNFFGTLNVTREVLPVMRKQRAGQIIMDYLIFLGLIFSSHFFTYML